MAGQVLIVFIVDGSSTHKPLGFDRKDFYYWKGRMKLFLRFRDVDL